MADNDTYPGEGKRKEIVNYAIEVAKTAQNTAYKYGGKDTNGFDCSGFVYYVFKKVFPDYTFLSADAIASSSQFTKITKSTPQPGDVIYFSSGTNPYEVKKNNNKTFPAHVGIVIDSQSWIGRQTSQLGTVPMTNLWWAGRSHEFYAYKKFDATSVSAAHVSILSDAK